MKRIDNQVIFSFDGEADLRLSAKFYRYIDTLRVSMKLRMAPQLCIGSYKGELENSVLMDYNDFEEHVRKSGWVDNQESILVISPLNYHASQKQGHLEFLDGSKDVYLGRWETTHKPELFDGWTHTNGRYYTCVK